MMTNPCPYYDLKNFTRFTIECDIDPMMHVKIIDSHFIWINSDFDFKVRVHE